MFTIISKRYKIYALQFNDFPQISSNITISLKTLKGQKIYQKLFGKFTKPIAKAFKYRLFYLDQSFLRDYSQPIENKESRDSIIDQFLHNPEKFKISVVSANGKNKKCRPAPRRRLLHIFQTMITDFFRENISIIKNRALLIKHS